MDNDMAEPPKAPFFYTAQQVQEKIGVTQPQLEGLLPELLHIVLPIYAATADSLRFARVYIDALAEYLLSGPYAIPLDSCRQFNRRPVGRRVASQALGSLTHELLAIREARGPIPLGSLADLFLTEEELLELPPGKVIAHPLDQGPSMTYRAAAVVLEWVQPPSLR